MLYKGIVVVGLTLIVLSVLEFIPDMRIVGVVMAALGFFLSRR